MLQIHEITDTNIVEIAIDGPIGTEDFDNTVAHLEAVLEEHKRIRVLEEVREIGGFPLSRIWDDVRFGMSYAGRISHAAIVGHGRWLEILTRVFDPLTKAKLKFFDASEIEDARAWLKSAV